MTSKEQHSGSNIRILDTTYTTELSNLQPSAIYFYRITANNSVRTTSSSVRMFITKERKHAHAAKLHRVLNCYTCSKLETDPR